MDLKPEEIGAVIKQQIMTYGLQTELTEEGYVISAGDGIARVYGLENCMASELLEFENNIFGMALNLEEENIGCVILGDPSHIKEGDTVRRTGRQLEIPVCADVLGRIINPLGVAIDGKGEIKHTHFRPMEFTAPGVVDRKSVNVPLQTGILAIDSMIPIGRGQRELIIGDRQTGKTAIAIDTIINQKNTGVVCVYVAIGQKSSTVAEIVNTLTRYGAMNHTVVVSSTASDPSSLQYIAPYAGCSIAEHFMYTEKKDVLIVYDDLSKHAVAYRAMSLLLRRPPGREAYPGDVFYLHSRLLERAAKLNDTLGGGSITALPIIETYGGDISAYIPTNVISITDGQIYLESELFHAGQRPAINVGFSVSRVGGNAQLKAMRKISGPLRINLAQYRELAVFSQFGSDLDKVTLDKLHQGERLFEALKQPQYDPIDIAEQVIILQCTMGETMAEIEKKDVPQYLKGLIEYIKGKAEHIFDSIRETGDLSKEAGDELNVLFNEYKENFSL